MGQNGKGNVEGCERDPCVQRLAANGRDTPLLPASTAEFGRVAKVEISDLSPDDSHRFPTKQKSG